MLFVIILVLVVLWLLGWIGHIGGGLIWWLLVIALVLAIWDLVTRRRV